MKALCLLIGNFGILAILSTDQCIVEIVSETLGDFPINLISLKY